MDQTTNFSQINYNILQQSMIANPELFNMNNINNPILNQMDTGLFNMFQQNSNQNYFNINQNMFQPNFQNNMNFPNMNMLNMMMLQQQMMNNNMHNNMNQQNMNCNNNCNYNNNDNKNVIPRKDNIISLNDFPYETLNNLRMICFHCMSGLRVFIRFPLNKTVKDLFILFAKKVGISEALLGKEIRFSFNAEFLNVNDNRLISEVFQDFSAITVVDN